MWDYLFNLLVNEILANATNVLVLIGVLGLALQKKPIERIMSGGIKIYIGYTIFNFGCSALIEAVNIFTKYSLKIVGAVEFLEKGTEGLFGTMPINTSYDSVMAAAAAALALSYVVNIILARITPLKIIYLTGHWSHWMCIMVSGVMMNYLGFSLTTTMIAAGIVVGAYAVIFPGMLQPYTKKLTGGAPIAYGHGSSFMCLVGSWIGTKIGNPDNSFEDINLSGRLSFLKEVVITVSLTMMILFLGMGAIVGGDFVTSISGGQNWILFSLFSGLKFCAGFMTILYGIRMFIAEITPAFKGISDKIVPGSVPAFDCPVFFQYGTNSLLIGFIISQACAIIALSILMKMNTALPIMMVTFENFFGGGVVALFANKFGGKRAAVVSAIVFGFSATLGRALFFHMLGPVVQFAQSFAEVDQIVVCSLVGYIGKLLGFALY